MAEPQTVAEGRVTDPCPECEREIPIPGRASPAMILGQHRAKEHGYVSPKREQMRAQAERRASGEARPRGRPRSEGVDAERVTPLHVLSDAGKEAGAGKGRKSPPNAKDLTNAFARIIGYADVAITSMMVDGDPRIAEAPADQQDDIHDQLVNLLCMDPDDAKAIGSPFGRMAAGTAINKRVGRKLVDNIDGLDAIVVIVETMRTKRRYLTLRRQWEADRNPAAPSAFDPPAPQPRPQPGQPGGYPKTPAGQNGVVISAEQVQAFRAAQGQNGHARPVEIPGAGPEGN